MSDPDVPPPLPPPQAAPAPRRAPRRSAWPWIVVLALAAGGGWWGYERYQASSAPAGVTSGAAAPAAKGSAKGGFGGPVPVVGVAARRGDLDVFLSALGTVTPLSTVTVKSRVEGQLMKVHFAEGQLVRQGQLLAEIDPRSFEAAVKQAEGQLARDQALLANARLDVERYRTLLAQDSIAKQQVDSQEALVRQYEGVVRVDQGQLENARLQLSYTRITAPVSGRAGLRLVDPGNIVRAGDATGLVVIAQIDPITVLFTLPQDTLPAVLKRHGAGAEVPVEAWDRELKARLATGTLAAIDNQVDTATGTFRLKANFANPSGALFPNQFVNVKMKLETLPGATIVPSAAIQRGAQSLFVYVVKDDSRVTARPVKLGPAEGANTAVTEGLAPGEVVVIDGIDRLREGAMVVLTKRPEFKPPVDGVLKKAPRRTDKSGDGKPAAGKVGAAAPAAPSTPGAAKAAGELSPEERRARWAAMSAEEKKAYWDSLSPEQKARILEAKAKREAERKAGN